MVWRTEMGTLVAPIIKHVEFVIGDPCLANSYFRRIASGLIDAILRHARSDYPCGYAPAALMRSAWWCASRCCGVHSRQTSIADSQPMPGRWVCIRC